MIPAKCDYYRARNLEEAVALLGRHENAKLLAGGHSLIPLMKLRLAHPSALVDIGRIADLKGICRDGDSVHIGALTTHAEIAASEVLAHHCPLLAEAAARIGDPQVRNKGTLGGNIAHADPASDPPAVLMATGATIKILGADGEREVAAADFFLGLLHTECAASEVITGVRVPAHGAATGSAYLKVEHPASGYAVCGAAAVMTIESGALTAGTLVFNGIAATPLAATAVTDALVGTSAEDSAIAAAINEHLEVGEPLGDIHASGPYRVALARVYGRRALELARDRALS